MITLAGMIGVGKSSATGLLSDHLGTKAYFEPVGNNPVLPEYYKNPKAYGFSLQIYFLNKRFSAIKKALYSDNAVMDRSIYEDLLFTELNHDNGNISDVNFSIYKNLLNNMLQELPFEPKKAPDLMIYLTADFDTILQHIKKRGREYEQIDYNPELKSYYRNLYRRYQPWYDKYNYSPKITIDLSHQDLADPNDRTNILKTIDDKLLQVGKLNLTQYENLMNKLNAEKESKIAEQKATHIMQVVQSAS